MYLLAICIISRNFITSWHGFSSYCTPWSSFDGKVYSWLFFPTCRAIWSHIDIFIREVFLIYKRWRTIICRFSTPANTTTIPTCVHFFHDLTSNDISFSNLMNTSPASESATKDHVLFEFGICDGDSCAVWFCDTLKYRFYRHGW